MEQYFRVYVNYLHDNWPDWLLLAEFTNNNTKLKTTKVSFFFKNKRFYSCISFESAKLSPSNIWKVNANVFAT